jgi:CRISPR/Cas system-associated exonuclease Cas4 (RecB family)
MHLDIEHFYNSSELTVDSMKRDDSWDPNLSPDWEMFMAYQERIGSKMTPYRTEWLVFNEEIKVAGSIDMLYKKKDGKYAIYDWKRSKEIKTENRFQSGLGPVMHLPDTNYWHYSLQLNIYRMILKQKYEIDVDEMALVILHPINNSWRVIKVNIMEDDVEAMFECRSRALQLPGNDGSNPIVVFQGMDHIDIDQGVAEKPKGWIGID